MAKEPAKCVATGRFEVARNRELRERAMAVPGGRSDGSENHRRGMRSARAMERIGKKLVVESLMIKRGYGMWWWWRWRSEREGRAESCLKTGAECLAGSEARDAWPGGRRR